MPAHRERGQREGPKFRRKMEGVFAHFLPQTTRNFESKEGVLVFVDLGPNWGEIPRRHNCTPKKAYVNVPANSVTTSIGTKTVNANEVRY